MAGNIIGGRAAARTNKARYGGDFYAKIGAIGGKLGHTGGFYANRELARRCGFVGGSISRRGKNKLTEKERREIRKAYEELLTVHNKAKQERARYVETQSLATRIDSGAVTVFDRKRGLVREPVA